LRTRFAFSGAENDKNLAAKREVRDLHHPQPVEIP
jgi:hypothetical protein